MKESESRRFPQRRNGVLHSVYGAGVVTLGRNSISNNSDPDGLVFVKFDDHVEPKMVKSSELTSFPSRSVSPDPTVSRNSRWIGGNNYRR